jgi:hypothetical protein
MTKNVFLFDIDGVLIHPGGYRESFKQSLSYLFEKWKIGPLDIPSDIPELFESFGVTNEWDMIPILFAVYIDRYLENVSQNMIITNMDDFIRVVSLPSDDSVNFQMHIGELASAISFEPVPAEKVLQGMDDKLCLNHLSKHPLLARYLLEKTRDINISLTTQVFQNFVLGSDIFSATYQREIIVDCPSGLKSYDKKIISETNQHWLGNKLLSDQICAAFYTARPSYPPLGIEADGIYAPEAEIAKEIIGIESIPLIAFGRVSYVAGLCGLSPDAFLKPSPYQALAAIGAALMKDEWAGLSFALEIMRELGEIEVQPENRSKDRHFDILPSESLCLYIFEDSPTGLRAGKRAAELLKRSGVNIDLHLIGITDHKAKRKALTSEGAVIFEDINIALENISDKIEDEK